MTVQAPIRIHVMGVSGVAGVQMTEGGISGWNDGGESITLRWD